MAWFNAGLSSNSGGASSFNELDDVAINTQTLSNGQVPVYNSTTHKWENGEQSGGSSGHTIIDDGGTSLTQRDNLQFKGAYSEDNSANGKTVVNVVREMTKAEFDELTDAEKTGLINVKDITGGNDDRFQPVIYSEEEREIGVWIDGKPLYQKTYEIDVSTLVVVSDWTTIDSTINGETMAGMEISVKHKTEYSSRFIAFRTDYVDPIPRFTIIQGAFKYFTDSSTFPYNNYVWTITIRYTKTTDQAGSGQWTPQGVPAHHYSTDEQIVGTWIDGSTIYEKTFVFSGVLVCSAYTWAKTSIDVDFDKVIQSEGIGDGTANVSIIAAKTSNGKLQIMNLRNTTVGVVSATIQYTKSST